jgi:hypothetical protein
MLAPPPLPPRGNARAPAQPAITLHLRPGDAGYEELAAVAQLSHGREARSPHRHERSSRRGTDRNREGDTVLVW